MDFKEKGRLAEEEFTKWLNKFSIPYIRLDQTVSSFSNAIKNIGGKRPDFIIFIPRFCNIFVDVKYIENTNFINQDGESCIPFRWLEKFKYACTESLLNNEVWFVISNSDLKFKKWYWISNFRAAISPKKLKKFKEDKIFPIPKKNFTEINEKDDLGTTVSKLVAHGNFDI